MYFLINMIHSLSLLTFLLFVYLGSLYACSLHQQEFLKIFGLPHRVKSPPISCPPGLCLSQYDYCGTDETYCGKGCKSGPCHDSGISAPLLPSRNDHYGQGTFFDPGLGACGTQSSGSEFVCAMAAPDFDPQTPNGNPNNNPLCGRYISVSGPQGTVTVKVVDRCPACHSGDLNLSPAAFNQIGDANQGRISIKWHYV